MYTITLREAKKRLKGILKEKPMSHRYIPTEEEAIEILNHAEERTQAYTGDNEEVMAWFDELRKIVKNTKKGKDD